MASRGHLGGLAGTTAESAAVLDACGFGLVFIETVGTGQSEVEVASIADTTVVVQAPEMGDEIQALKADYEQRIQALERRLAALEGEQADWCIVFATGEHTHLGRNISNCKLVATA